MPAALRLVSFLSCLLGLASAQLVSPTATRTPSGTVTATNSPSNDFRLISNADRGPGLSQSLLANTAVGYAFSLQEGVDIDFTRLGLTVKAPSGQVTTTEIRLYPANTPVAPFVTDPQAQPSSKVAITWTSSSSFSSQTLRWNVTGLTARSSVSLTWVIVIAARTNSFDLFYSSLNGYAPTSLSPAVPAVLGRAGIAFGSFYCPFQISALFFALDLFGIPSNSSLGVVSVTPTPPPIFPPSISNSPVESPAAFSPLVTPSADPLNGLGQRIFNSAVGQPAGGNAIVPPFSGLVGYAFVIPSTADPIFLDSITFYPICNGTNSGCTPRYTFSVHPVGADGLPISCIGARLYIRPQRQQPERKHVLARLLRLGLYP